MAHIEEALQGEGVSQQIAWNEIAEGATLGNNDAKQDALVGYFLDNEDFFLQARIKIRPEWLNDPVSSRIWKAKCDFFDEYARAPRGLDEFRATMQFMAQDQETRNRMIKQIARCQAAKEKYGLDVLRTEITAWLQTQYYKTYVEKSLEVFNNAEVKTGPDAAREIKKAIDLLHEGSASIKTANFDLEQAVQFDDIANGAFFVRRQEELQNACTFGLPMLDRLLNANAVGDCALLRGDHTVLLAPTNVGKTTAMVNVIVANIKKSKSVLLLTHEGTRDDLKTKIICCLTGMTYQQLRNAVGDEKQVKVVERFQQMLSKYLVFVPVNKPGMTVEDVEVVIRQQRERRVTATGKGFDLLVDDYPAKLTTVLASKGSWNRRGIDEYVYNFFTQIGLEMNMHILSAIQTNREGNKINGGRAGAEIRLLTLDDVMESFGTMTTATNVISLNRDPEAQRGNRMTFHICKSRSSEVGWSIVTKTDFSKAITFGHKLPATYYRGNSVIADNVMAGLIDNYNGKLVPDHYYYG